LEFVTVPPNKWLFL